MCVSTSRATLAGMEHTPDTPTHYPRDVWRAAIAALPTPRDPHTTLDTVRATPCRYCGADVVWSRAVVTLADHCTADECQRRAALFAADAATLRHTLPPALTTPQRPRYRTDRCYWDTAAMADTGVGPAWESGHRGPRALGDASVTDRTPQRGIRRRGLSLGIALRALSYVERHRFSGLGVGIDIADTDTDDTADTAPVPMAEDGTDSGETAPPTVRVDDRYRTGATWPLASTYTDHGAPRGRHGAAVFGADGKRLHRTPPATDLVDTHDAAAASGEAVRRWHDRGDADAPVPAGYVTPTTAHGAGREYGATVRPCIAPTVELTTELRRYLIVEHRRDGARGERGDAVRYWPRQVGWTAADAVERVAAASGASASALVAHAWHRRSWQGDALPAWAVLAELRRGRDASDAERRGLANMLRVAWFGAVPTTAAQRKRDAAAQRKRAQRERERAQRLAERRAATDHLAPLAALLAAAEAAVEVMAPWRTVTTHPTAQRAAAVAGRPVATVADR